MKKINRSTFLRQSMGMGASIYLLPAFGFPECPTFGRKNLITQLWGKMVSANEAHVNSLLEHGDAANRHGGRSFGYNFAILSAAYACKDSRFHRADSVVDLLNDAANKLIASQRPDGTINAGNLESPPDTAFIMEPLCAGAYILIRLQDEKLDPVMGKIKIL